MGGDPDGTADLTVLSPHLLCIIEGFAPLSPRSGLSPSGDEKALALLKEYVLTEVGNLYSSASGEEANLERIAASLERGAAVLDELAHRLRRSVGSGV